MIDTETPTKICTTCGKELPATIDHICGGGNKQRKLTGNGSWFLSLVKTQ